MIRYRLAILAAAVLWSTAGAAIKLTALSSWQINSGRSLIAAAVLFLALPGSRRMLSRKGFLVALAYAATVALFVIANKLTTAANAIFIQDTAPVWVLLLSPLLLKESASKSELTAAPVFLVGLALFFFDRLQPGQLAGNLVALASGVAFSLCIMGLRGQNREAQAILVWGNVIAGVLTLWPAFEGPAPGPTDWGILAFLGIVQLGLAYALFQYGLRETKAVEASLLALPEPVLNALWAFLLVNEVPGKWALVGGAIILLATLWRTLAAGRARPPAPA